MGALAARAGHRTHPMKTISRLALAAALALAPGCLGTRTGRPERIGTRNVAEFSRSDAAEPTAWLRVLVGGARPRVRGYVKSTPIELERREQGRLHWVYDQAFVLVGRVSPRGETMRIDDDGNETYTGSYKLEHAVLMLLGGGREDEVKLSPMPNPRRG